LARLQRHVERFLIVFIFTSGVGNGLLKPVHRLCSVSAEIVSNAPDVPSVETMEALPTFDSGTQQETFHGISNGSLSAQSITVNTPKSRDAIARRASNEEGGVVSSTAIDNGAQRTSAQPNKQGEKVTYGERLRRLASQGNRDENGEADGSYKTRNGFFQTDKVKSEAVYSTEAVEYRHERGEIPRGNLSPVSPESPDKSNGAISGTHVAVERGALLRSNGETSTETVRSKVAGDEAQAEVSDEKTRTETAHISKADTKAKEDALRYETRQTLLKNVEETWAVQNNHNVPAATETVSPKIPLPQPETLQQYAKRIILPQIHIDRVPLSETLKIISDVVKTDTANERTVNFILTDPKKAAPEVDLDIRDVSLERVLHYLSEMTQFTVLYEDNTVIFRDPSLKQTLRTCMFPISRGSVLQILSYTDLHNSDEEKKLSEEERLKQFFQRIGIPMNDKNIGFAYDGANLIVTHEELWLQRIEGILQQYRQCKQIAIEAKFLEVTQGALDELGLKFNAGTQKGARVGVSDLALLRRMSVLDSATNLAGGLDMAGGLNYGGNYGNFIDALPVLNGYQTRVVLRAIEQHTDSDLMCTPKVTVLSGRKAEIVIADEFRYPQSYRDGIANVGNDGRGSTAAGVAILAGAPENFTTRNVGIEMTVTPVAEHDGHIHLTLEPKVTQLAGFSEYGGANVTSSSSGTENYSAGFTQPTFATRKIKTELSIKSGSTVVMGGLTREEVKETHDRIPLFGDIPIFGKLFQSKGKTSQKKNLLIFVTANLVDENGQYIVEPEFKVSKSL
jgi:general secretion pathway protein D